MLVAEKDGKIVGGLLGGAYAKRGMICHLGVAPTLQKGNGIGTRLYEESLVCFRNLGVTSIHLIVTKGNSSAVEYWERRGFERDQQYVTLERDIDERPCSSAEIVDFSQDSGKACECVPCLMKRFDFGLSEWSDLACLQESVADRNCILLGRDEADGHSLEIAGSFGFRAQIAVAVADTEQDFLSLINAALEQILDMGVHRIHTRVERNDADIERWSKAGFREQDGETTLQLSLQNS